MNNQPEPNVNTMAETDNYIVWKADEPDSEMTYHIELNNITLHFFQEEWSEFMELMKNIKSD
ncbi:MAG: hypothetical protein JEZ06_23890 [Anaerolineaceae bacterium]|nr:hypothetical protein [Anaerolineaceae bacterium]